MKDAPYSSGSLRDNIVYGSCLQCGLATKHETISPVSARDLLQDRTLCMDPCTAARQTRAGFRTLGGGSYHQRKQHSINTKHQDWSCACACKDPAIRECIDTRILPCANYSAAPLTPTRAAHLSNMRHTSDHAACARRAAHGSTSLRWTR